MPRMAPPAPKRSPVASSGFLPGSGYDAADARRRIGRILQSLARTYPHARTALKHASPFELLIATILSAQATDEIVNRVTPALFQRYSSPDQLAIAEPAQVEAIIKPTGFYHQKAKAIIGSSRGLCERHGGQVPARMDDLVQLPGVARKTANVVLANCWPRPASDHGIFVDTHVRRVSQRLALTPNDRPEAIERDLIELVPDKDWADVPHQLIELGRGPCKARSPRHEICPLLDVCPTGKDSRGPRAPSKTRERPKPRPLSPPAPKAKKARPQRG